MKSWNHSLWLFSALVVVFGIIVFFSLYSYSPSFFVSSSEAGSSLWTNNSGVATYEGDININGINIHTEQITGNSTGGYLTLDGVDDYVDFGNLPVSNWDEISVAGWMRLRDFSETVMGVSIQHSGPDDIRLYYKSEDGLS